MTKPYPSTSLPPSRESRQPPAPVRNAVFFMYAGAALSVINGILAATGGAALRASIRHARPHYSPAQVSGLASAEIIYSVVYTLALIFLWLWLAWACRAGKAWARITASILFGANTVLLVLTVATRASAGVLPHVSAGSILPVLGWAAGLGAMVLLWRRESSAYFTRG